MMPTTPPPTSEPVRLQCNEVWGGNRAIQSGIATPAIQAWIDSRPFDGDDAGGDIHYVSL